MRPSKTALGWLILAVLFTGLTVIKCTQDANAADGPIYTIEHVPNQQTVEVGQVFTIDVIYHANLADTTVFSRMALDYDSTVVRCIAIENGADVPPDFYQQPFVNWGPVCFKTPKVGPSQFERGSIEWAREQVFIEGCPNPGYEDYVAMHVYLGQFFQPGCAAPTGQFGCTCEQWTGHAITYTFVAVGEGTTPIWYPEKGVNMNYVDMQPWLCATGYIAEYTSDPGHLGTCTNPLFLPQNSSVTVSGFIPVAVERTEWSNIKGLYR